MVWDAIWRESGVGSPVEEWGGISYSLAAADAINPFDYKVRPIVKLGRDLAERGFDFLKELSVIESYDGISVVDELNPRVELRYTGESRRCEQIVAGVPPWTWQELAPLVDGCDALYVNFITGMEFDLPVALELRRNFEGPIYVDIHYLMMSIGPTGERHPRRLTRWSEWLSCFDAVQLNEDELAALGSPRDDPWTFAREVVGRETGMIFVTLGSGGAAYVVAPDAMPLEARRGWQDAVSPLRSGRLEVEPVEGGDPTGCGDVWGVTAYGALLGGADVEEAVRRANSAARRNVSHSGASGLNRYLLGGGIERA
jgi:sugar/nucleoside kinase (ribokinase family)